MLSTHNTLVTAWKTSPARPESAMKIPCLLVLSSSADRWGGEGCDLPEYRLDVWTEVLLSRRLVLGLLGQSMSSCTPFQRGGGPIVLHERRARLRGVTRIHRIQGEGTAQAWSGREADAFDDVGWMIWDIPAIRPMITESGTLRCTIIFRGRPYVQQPFSPHFGS